uniref:Uncharacterized protein n=1 Tax=viral metagenome TaxID=1070528 RepID=A0A6C0EQD7_9ZZZZ
MDINILSIGIFGLGIAYMVYTVPKVNIEKQPERSGLLVAQDTGKSKQIQSKTGDASMRIELRRRQTIQTSGKSDHEKLREATYQKGSTTGAIETYMLSSILTYIPKCLPYDTIYDGGDEKDEFCTYEGDGSSKLDGGNETTKACRL